MRELGKDWLIQSVKRWKKSKIQKIYGVHTSRLKERSSGFLLQDIERFLGLPNFHMHDLTHRPWSKENNGL